MAAHEAQVMIRGLMAYPDVDAAINRDLLFGVTNQALIIVSKFIEVWDDSGRLVESERRWLGLRRSLTPIVRRMQVWRGLKSMRNTSLAHAYLSKEGEPVPPWQLIEDGEAPGYHAEIILLLYLVHIAVLCTLSVFVDVYMPIDPLARSTQRDLLPSAAPGIQYGEDIKPTLDALAAEVALSIRNECGVEITGSFAERFQATLKPRGV